MEVRQSIYLLVFVFKVKTFCIDNTLILYNLNGLNLNSTCTPEVSLCQFALWISNRSTSLVIICIKKKKGLRGNSCSRLEGTWKEPQHIRWSQETPRRIIKEIKQAVKRAFSYCQMLTFQTRHPSTNWQVLMVLTFRRKVLRVLTFSKGGLLSGSFNFLGPAPSLLFNQPKSSSRHR